MLDKIKLALRLSSDAFDDEISSLIIACKLDLDMSGIDTSLLEDDDDLYIEAIRLYCKSKFGLDNPYAEKYWDAYVSLRTHMTTAKEYRYEPSN